MFPMKCYWILQNARVTAFTVFELLRETLQGGKITLTPSKLGLTGKITLTLLIEYFWKQ